MKKISASLHKKIFGFFVSLIVVLSSSVAFASNGCIVNWIGNYPNLIPVDLPQFNGSGIANDLVQLDTSQMNSTVDVNQPLCFSLDDERLLQIHVYYWANQQIAFFNRIFHELGLHPLRQVTVKLIPVSKVQVLDDEGGTASVEKNSVSLFYRRPIIDTTILLHEIGHLVHSHLQGGGFHQSSVESQAIDEGFADLMVAFFNGETVMFPRTLGCDPSRDINLLVRFPQDALTFEQALRDLLTDEKFKKNCPKSFETVGKMLSGEISVPLKEFEPHHLSRVISRPIWRSFQKQPSIRNSVIQVFATTQINNFGDLINALLKESSKSPITQEILKKEFSEVGFNSSFPTP